MRNVANIFTSILIPVAVFLFPGAPGAYSQLFNIRGATVFTNTSSVVFVDGTLSNDSSGTLVNEGSLTVQGNFSNNAFASGNGTYRISGDWMNNDSFDCGTGDVLLEGDDQILSGIVPTTFHNLSLQGTGIKTQTINASVINTLDLTDRELATDSDTMFILSADPGAILYTTGFVSSLGDGCLSRVTAEGTAYIFPVGSSLDPPRYRPVEITPESMDSSTFAVRFANNDASIDGYDRTMIDSTFCGANPAFYHRINRTSGAYSADIAIFYDNAEDNYWNGLAQWKTSPQTWWQNTNNATVLYSSPFTSITMTGWNDFTSDPYILTRDSLTVNLGPDTTICVGDEITLMAPAGCDSIFWSTGDTNVQSITVSVAQNYSVTVTLGICSTTDQIKISPIPLPDAMISGDTLICSGENITLTATEGMDNYQWNTPDTTQIITVNPAVTTTYTVTVTNNGCSDSDSITVTVDSIPAVTVSGNDTICYADSTILTVTGGSSWFWSTGDSTSAISVSPQSTATYSVTASDNVCYASDSITVTVFSTPAGFAPADHEICEGDSVELTVSGEDHYLWSTGDTTGTIQVNPSTTTSYFVTATSGSCSGTDTVTVTVNAAISANAVEDTAICEGESVTLMATGGSEYLWSTLDTSQSISVNPSVTTTYTVTVTEGICTGTDSVVVTINPVPDAGAGNDTEICSGDTVLLTASGGTSFLWSSSDTSQGISVSPAGTTVYYVTVTEGSCSSSDSVTVTVHSLPDAEAGPDQEICEGDETTLSASGAPAYLWSTSETSQSITVNPSTSTMYYVTVTNSDCSATDSVMVTVNPAPSADAGNDRDICVGDTIQLTADGGDSYLWSTGSSDSVITVSPATETVYYVTATLGICQDTDSVLVMVSPVPVADAGDDQTICEGVTVVLSATGGDSYLWNTSETASDISVHPSATTTYTVTVTTGNCTDTDDVTVTVLDAPDANAGADVSVCYGTSVQLNASGGDTYQWNNSGYLSGSYISNPVAYPPATTAFTVTVTSGQCSVSDTVIVTVYPLPSVFAGNDITITGSGSAQLYATGDPGVRYQWSPATGLNNPDIANPVADVDDTTVYTVTATNIYGCHSSDSVTVFVTGNAEAGDLIFYSTFTPNNDGVNDTWYIENIDKYPENYLEIYNRNGHKVYEKDNYQNEWDGKYFGNDLPAATYYYILYMENDTDIKRGNVTIVR